VHAAIAAAVAHHNRNVCALRVLVQHPVGRK
jgi:hypothetical protein